MIFLRTATDQKNVKFEKKIEILFVGIISEQFKIWMKYELNDE